MPSARALCSASGATRALRPTVRLSNLGMADSRWVGYGRRCLGCPGLRCGSWAEFCVKVHGLAPGEIDRTGWHTTRGSLANTRGLHESWPGGGPPELRPPGRPLEEVDEVTVVEVACIIRKLLATANAVAGVPNESRDAGRTVCGPRGGGADGTMPAGSRPRRWRRPPTSRSRSIGARR